MAVEKIITRNNALQLNDLQNGALLLVDKPYAWTSFDVVNKLRFAIRSVLKIKKYKVGHAGTLDPLATGLLLICIGPYTKEIESLMGLDKEYTGEIALGATTPSYDAESPINCYYPIPTIDQAHYTQFAQQWIGVQDQMPPAFSAIKRDGVAQYKLARKGQEVKLEPRNIRIDQFDIEKHGHDMLKFKVKCSKGTYIRSLAFDLGKALHSGAYLHQLRRESIGDYKVTHAWSVEEMVLQINNLALQQ